MPETFELSNQTAGLACGVTSPVVVAAELRVDLSGGEHVPKGDKDGVLDRSESAAVADAGTQALVEGLQVAALGAGGSERRF